MKKYTVVWTERYSDMPGDEAAVIKTVDAQDHWHAAALASLEPWNDKTVVSADENGATFREVDGTENTWPWEEACDTADAQLTIHAVYEGEPVNLWTQK